MLHPYTAQTLSYVSHTVKNNKQTIRHRKEDQSQKHCTCQKLGHVKSQILDKAEPELS